MFRKEQNVTFLTQKIYSPYFQSKLLHFFGLIRAELLETVILTFRLHTDFVLKLK